MSTDNFKQDVHAQLARVGKALSNGNRLELLDFVAQGPRSVDELATMTRLSVAHASEERAGRDVVDLIAALGLVAETRLAEMAHLVRTYITARDDLEPVPAAELLKRSKQGLRTVLGVGPVPEVGPGRFRGA